MGVKKDGIYELEERDVNEGRPNPFSSGSLASKFTVFFEELHLTALALYV